MNHAPASTPLFLAVLDGQDPQNWPLYGERFRDLMAEARQVMRPYAVTPELLQQYNVEIEPILVGPQALLEEERLDKVVGIIIDTLPKERIDEDLKQKLEILRRHIRQIKRKCQSNDGAMFKRFGYRFWFVTDDANRIADFVQHVRDMAGDMLNGTAEYDVAYIVEKGLLIHHLNAYLSDIYYELGSGR